MAEAANSGRHSLASLSPEITNAVVASPSKLGEHMRLLVREAAQAPRASCAENLLPLPRGFFTAAATREMFAGLKRQAFSCLVLLCSCLNALFTGGRTDAVPEAEPSPLQVTAVKHLVEDVMSYFADADGPLDCVD